MVIYFTGTGNSRYVAQRLANRTNDTAVALARLIKAKNTQPVEVNGRLILITPTYAWRIPRIVRDWLCSVELCGVTGMWFVMTCGGEMGNAARYNRELCEAGGLSYMGTAQVVMPENYIAMFNAPDAEAARSIVAKAEPVIDEIAGVIAADRAFSRPRSSLYDRFMSGPVNDLFYRFFVKADAFRVTDECISCGTCESLCPLNNISLKGGRPTWGKNCTHCMACICHCPAEAIEYGQKSVGKPRYHI